ncbi:MAG: carbonic anhydrase [Woeseiaceae bacterium]
MAAADALHRLRDGNRRFVNAERSNVESLSEGRRAELAASQDPFAVILACSDSRVPVELVFDQGLGDLFVIRVAGNIVAPSQIGSIEYAASQLGTRLVVVLGHSNCGAVDATLAELTRAPDHRSPNLQSIVDRIRPAVEPLLDAPDGPTLPQAVLANVRQSVAQLRHGSAILEELIATDGLAVVGAKYWIETGEVRFFDD